MWMIFFFAVFAALCAFKAWQWWSNVQRIKAERLRGERSFGDIVLAPDAIRKGNEVQRIVDVTATVETVGQLQRRITATRLATFGAFALALQKKRDDRELYMTITGPSFAWLLVLEPAEGQVAREFAAAVNNASRGAV